MNLKFSRTLFLYIFSMVFITFTLFIFLTGGYFGFRWKEIVKDVGKWLHGIC